MKRRLCASLWILGIGFFMAVGKAFGAVDGVVANETGLTYNNSYAFPIDDVSNLSMQVNYTSTTFASKTFTDGTQSTGSFTVVSFTALSTATATNTITVSSNSAIAGATLTIGGATLVEGRQWVFDVNYASNTACNLANAIKTYTVYLSTCGTSPGTVVYSTAPATGSGYNTSVVSSTQAALVATNFTGGRDNQTLSANGVTITANVDFFPLTSTTVTATNIKNAFNASAASQTISFGSGGAVVSATSTAVGTGTAYTLTSSSNAACGLSGVVTLSGSAGSTTMTGGTNAGYDITTEKITIASHGFTTALPVLYSTGVVAIGGLTNQTTYYAVVLDANTIGLSSTSVVAQAGNYLNLTSSSTQTTAHTYTLAPLAISGTPSFRWEVSNDNANWSALTANTYNVSVSSVTMTSYTAGGATSIWDLGPVTYKSMRLNVIGPTQGGILLKALIHGKIRG